MKAKHLTHDEAANLLVTRVKDISLYPSLIVKFFDHVRKPGEELIWLEKEQRFVLIKGKGRG